MSWNWLIRSLLIGALCIYLLVSRTMLRDRKRYDRVLESGPLNVVFVAIYNALCYLAVGIRSDPKVIAKPAIFENMLIVHWYAVFGQILVLGSVGLLVYTVFKRHAIGGQDTGGRLLTSGIYRFSRHPIYLGIVLISLGISIVRVNFDGMLVFPLVFIANFVQARLEEFYDVGKRFKDEYEAYRAHTHMFGSYWFWLGILLILIVPVLISLLG
ncbi:MAG: methyltransferase [candidate division WOR-3 bacterium]